MEAVVGQGIGEIHFGISDADLQVRLGSPDKREVNDVEDICLIYNDLRCTFQFSEGRLHWIRCANPAVVLFGRKLIGQPCGDAMRFLKRHLADSIDVEDYGEMESHTFSSNWLELQFEYGVLDQICFGHLFGEDDEPIWPSA